MDSRDIIERVREELGKMRSVDEILSHPNIAIIDPDAELPNSNVPPITNYTIEYNEIYRKAQQDMLKANWRKVVE